MDMFDLFVVLVVLSAVVSAIRWLFVGYRLFKSTSVAVRNFESQLRDAEKLAAAMERAGLGGESALPGGTQLPAIALQQQMQLQRALGSLNSQMRQLDDLRRQRYDLRVSELQGMAAQAGISWTPPT
ncbi:MAG TPA: hypothetical protein VFP65_22170 [Anaeromyxobacteraceae bacterium]|nr:hypothetical protein [Anaeromyxobacteraceae bacterium]